MEEEKKLTEEEFVIQAIKKLRKDPYRGIHSVYSGFNEAFRKYFGTNPVEATTRLAAEGKIENRPFKGGMMLFLPGEAPKRPTTDEIIQIIAAGDPIDFRGRVRYRGNQEVEKGSLPGNQQRLQRPQ